MASDLISQVREKMETIRQLQMELDELKRLLNGGAPTGSEAGAASGSETAPITSTALAIQALRDTGKPMHVGKMLAWMEAHGHTVSKTTLVGNLSRLNKAGKVFIRTARPNTFGLREWTAQGKQL